MGFSFGLIYTIDNIKKAINKTHFKFLVVWKFLAHFLYELMCKHAIYINVQYFY